MEVIVASAIFLIVGIAMKDMVLSSFKAQKKVENSLDYIVLKTTVKMILDDNKTCKGFFKNSAGTQVAKYKPGTNFSDEEKFGSLVLASSPIAKIGQDLGGGLSVKTLELKDLGVNATIGGHPSYMAELIIEAEKPGAPDVQRVISNRSNPFRLKIVADKTTSDIIACSTDLAGSDENNSNDSSSSSSASSTTSTGDFVDAGGFLIQSRMSKGLNFYDAALSCANINATLCSWAQWSVACHKGLLSDVIFGSGGIYEWIDGYAASYDAVVLANPKIYKNCRYPSRGTPGAVNLGFRCCRAKASGSNQP